MEVTVDQIVNLNDRIEKINKERTKAETRVEMRKKSLDESLSGYEKKYGITLKGKDFAETAKNVKAELQKVTEAVKSEYDLKEKVVSCIEQGDFDTAYSLLGIENPNENVEIGLEPEVEQGSDVAEVDGSLDFGIDEDMGVEDDDTVDVEDDDEVQDLGADAFKSAVANATKKVDKDVKGTSAVKAVADMEMEMELDDDSIPSLDDDDFGFGDILKGTEFEVDED